MNTHYRLPRPLGTTQPAQNKKPIKRLKHIEKKFIEEYIDNDYIIHGHRMSLESFSMYTNIPMKRVQDGMIMRASNIDANMEEGQMEGTLRAIISQLFRGTLADRATVLQQQSLLLMAQGGKYKPFITGEVNNGIKNLFGANDQILKTLKALLPNSGFKDMAPSDSGLTQGTSTFTHDRALELIAEVGPKPLLESPDNIKLLEAQYDIKNMPEVLAHKQEGWDTSKEGLNFDDIDKIQMEAMEKQKEAHTDRRVHEEGLDIQDVL